MIVRLAHQLRAAGVPVATTDVTDALWSLVLLDTVMGSPGCDIEPELVVAVLDATMGKYPTGQLEFTSMVGTVGSSTPTPSPPGDSDQGSETDDVSGAASSISATSPFQHHDVGEHQPPSGTTGRGVVPGRATGTTLAGHRGDGVIGSGTPLRPAARASGQTIDASRLLAPPDRRPAAGATDEALQIGDGEPSHGTAGTDVGMVAQRESSDGRVDHDLDRVRRVAVRTAQRIGGRPGRRSVAPSGPVDLRRTVGASVARGSLLPPIRNRRHRTLPDLAILVDISASVREHVPLALRFAHALARVTRGSRVLLATDRAVEVTQSFRVRPLADALERALHDSRIDLSADSDWGQVFQDFAESAGLVRHGTTVIIAGDGRSGAAPERRDVLESIVARASRVVWMTPEPSAAWTTGRGSPAGYAKSIHAMVTVRVPSDLDQIADLVVQRGSLASGLAGGVGERLRRNASR